MPRIEDVNITNNRKLGKKSKQKSTEKSVEVEHMNNLDLTSIFSSLFRDEGNVTVCNPITPPNLTLKDPFISESCIEIKIQLNFYFHTSLWCTKRFYGGLFIKAFEAPQRSVKIKI